MMRSRETRPDASGIRPARWIRPTAVAMLALAGGSLAGCAAHRDHDPLAEDRRITTEVLRIISENDELVAEDLRVETREGVVVISGVQRRLEAVADLLQRVGRVRGVTEVVNRIRILRTPDGREDAPGPDQPSQSLATCSPISPAIAAAERSS